jgi:hypothetical protein
MSKREKEDKGGEEAGTKHQSAEELGRELLKAAEEGDVEKVRELLRCEGVDARYHVNRGMWGVPRTARLGADWNAEERQRIAWIGEAGMENFL